MQGESNAALITEIQRRLKDDRIGEEIVRNAVWEFLKPDIDDLIEKSDGELTETSETPDTTELYHIIKELGFPAYGVCEFDSYKFRELLKNIGIHQPYAQTF